MLATIQTILSLNHPINYSSIVLTFIVPIEVSAFQYHSIIYPMFPSIILFCHSNHHSLLSTTIGLTAALALCCLTYPFISNILISRFLFPKLFRVDQIFDSLVSKFHSRPSFANFDLGNLPLSIHFLIAE